MSKTVDTPALVSAYDDVNHPEHPLHNHDDVLNPLLLAAIIKGTPLLTGALIASGCAYIGLNNPETKQVFPVCGFYAMTGLYCPGCGMTRALHSLLGGHIIRAIRFNLMLVVAIPFLMYAYIWWTNWAFTGREMPKLKFSKRTIWIICVSAIIFVVGRDLPTALSHYFSLGR